MLQAEEITEANGNRVKLLKIRNCDTDFEWEGDWSDESAKWTPELAQQLNLEVKSDGIFWISLDDFMERYISLHICKFVDGYNFFNFEQEEWSNKDGYHIFSAELS